MVKEIQEKRKNEICPDRKMTIMKNKRPSPELAEFHRRFFSGTDVEIYSEEVFDRLLMEIGKSKEGLIE